MNVDRFLVLRLIEILIVHFAQILGPEFTGGMTLTNWVSYGRSGSPLLVFFTIFMGCAFG